MEKQREDLNKPLSEETIKKWEDFDISKFVRDEAYWKRHDAHAIEMMKGMVPMSKD